MSIVGKKALCKKFQLHVIIQLSFREEAIVFSSRKRINLGLYEKLISVVGRKPMCLKPNCKNNQSVCF